MRVKVALVALAFGVGIAGMALAADDPIQARKAIMKNNAEAAKVAFGMAQGKVPYDATAAAAAMKTLQDDMVEFPTLFPAGSDTGDTAAGIVIARIPPVRGMRHDHCEHDRGNGEHDDRYRCGGGNLQRFHRRFLSMTDRQYPPATIRNNKKRDTDIYPVPRELPAACSVFVFLSAGTPGYISSAVQAERIAAVSAER